MRRPHQLQQCTRRNVKSNAVARAATKPSFSANILAAYWHLILLLLITFAASSASFGQALNDKGLAIYTENYPPLNYEENGEAKGLSVDLMLEIFKRAELPYERHNITVVPWARGYTETQRRPNSILFSTVRTPEREGLFKWVGPIGVSRMVLITKRDASMTLNNAEDFNKFKFGVVQHSRGDQALQFEAGVEKENFIYLNSPLSAAHMLARERVDGWAFERIVAFWVLQKLGYRAQDFKVSHAFNQYHYYFALHPDTDDAFIAKLQTALDSINADGTLAAIVEGHIPGAAGFFLVER
jgi:polar amino acid transport system substrate-binding protein